MLGNATSSTSVPFKILFTPGWAQISWYHFSIDQ